MMISFDIFIALSKLACFTIISVTGLWCNVSPRTDYKPLLVDAEKEKSKSYGGFSAIDVENERNPYERANIISKILFLWPTSLMALGYKKPIDFSDLWDLMEEDKCEYNFEKFDNNWKNQLNKPKPALWKALFSTYGFWFCVSGIGKIIQDGGTLMGPLILNRIVTFIQDTSTPLSTGMLWALAMFGTFVLQSLGANAYLFVCSRMGNQVRAALTASIYRKSMRISASAKAKFSTGEIINIQSADPTRIGFMLNFLHMIWSAPILIIVAFYLLWDFLGAPMLAGIGVMVILLPINGLITRKMIAYQKVLMTKKDARLKLMHEVLAGIRLVKFFNWEENFFTKILQARFDEVQLLRYTAYTRAALMSVFSSSSLWVAIASFAAYSLSGKELTAEVAFTALALFNTLRVPLGFLPMVIGGVVEAKVSINRIQKFLEAEDVDLTAVQGITKEEEDHDVAVSVQDGTFKWGEEAHTVALSDINFTVKRGELLAVVGAVGSGKSSLLAAMLGEIQKIKGKVRVGGTTAYVPQQAWMQNASVRDNILFGNTYDEDKYHRCIQASELAADIQILPSGDKTEIGEKGINLSGGQKQRISLARAMYQNASIYFFDAPLSAVDAHVGSAIFNNLIKRELRNKTRVLVTHQLDILHQVDRIVVLKEGRIVEIGTYEELIRDGLEFSELVKKHVGIHDSKKSTDAKEEQKAGDKPKAKVNTEGKGALMTQEEKREGSVEWQVYKRYMAAASTVFFAIVLALFALDTGVKSSADWWLSYWTTNATPTNTHRFLIIYVIWGLVSVVITLIRSFAYLVISLRASISLHNDMLRRILHAPVSFFDTTPIDGWPVLL
eukprot:Phypoly_transcript_00366.p1 GENE.Phypoly_transcript_00366~~Phypoly_transcript_00366.p1  ORF type:complete len:840 (+),score=118.23 Phypoly_transcript_00366:911-3430(+)